MDTSSRAPLGGDGGLSPDEAVNSHIDCSSAISRMFVFIDNELDQADYHQIQVHLEECGPCLEKYNLERTVKALVRRSCCAEVAPEQLRRRVLLSIREVQYRIDED